MITMNGRNESSDRSNPQGKLIRKAFLALVAVARKKDEVSVP